jgi:hypothetical protein
MIRGTRAGLTLLLSGPNAQQVSQQDIEADLARLRGGVDKLKAVPRLTLGIGLSF